MFNKEILKRRLPSNEKVTDAQIARIEERLMLENREKIRAIQDGTRFEILNAVRRLNMLREIDSEDSGATKVRIAAATEYSIPTVTRIIDLLQTEIIDATQTKLSDSPIYEDPKKPNKYEVNPEYGYFVGIHLGIQKIRISICDFAMKPLNGDALKDLFSNYEDVMPDEFKDRFKVLDSFCTFKTDRIVPPDKHNNESHREEKNNLNGRLQALTFNRLQELVCFVVQFLYDCFIADKKNLLSICIATPAVCDFQTMDVKHCAGLNGLKDTNLAELLDSETTEVLDRQCILYGFEHNTEAVLLYEREQLYKNEKMNKSCKDSGYYDNIATVYIGSDIGVAFIVNGSLYRGRLGTSGELGALWAPNLPGFEESELLEKLREEAFDAEEENIGFLEVTKDLEKNMKQNYLTLEAAIRYRVFNILPSEYERFLTRIHNTDMLKHMKTQKRTRFNLLVQYISYISNVLINLLSMDIIIYGGAICSAVDGLISEVAKIKYSAALHCLAKETVIRGPMDCREDDIVSIGAAHAALMQCDEINHVENNKDAGSSEEEHKKSQFSVNLPLKFSWKKLGV